MRQRRARRVLAGLLLPSVTVSAIGCGTDVRCGGRNVEYLDAPAERTHAFSGDQVLIGSD